MQTHGDDQTGPLCLRQVQALASLVRHLEVVVVHAGVPGAQPLRVRLGLLQDLPLLSHDGEGLCNVTIDNGSTALSLTSIEPHLGPGSA